jgi:hypothetical protein
LLHSRKRGDRRLLRQAEGFAVREQGVIFGDVITSAIEKSAHITSAEVGISGFDGGSTFIKYTDASDNNSWVQKRR